MTASRVETLTSRDQARERLGALLQESEPSASLRPVLLQQVPLVASKARREPQTVQVVEEARPSFFRRRLASLKNVFLGSALEISEGFKSFTAPVLFCVRYAGTIFLGLMTLAVPAGVAALLWNLIPGWAQTYPLNQSSSWLFLLGVGLTTLTLMTTIALLLRALGKGLGLLTGHLSNKGARAFR